MTADTREFYRSFLKRLRYGLAPQNRPAMAKIVSQTIDQMASSVGLPRADIRALQSDGVMRIPALVTAEHVTAARRALSPLSVHDGWNRTSGTFTLDQSWDIPRAVHVAHYDAQAIAACPELIYAATSPAAIGAATTYFGCLPTISNVVLWWSLAGRAAPEDAQLWHKDFHDYRWLKLFVALTDVDAESGPTEILKGSQRPEFFSERSKIAGSDTRRWFDMHNAQRKSDDDINYFFPGETVSMTCAAGDAYLADTAAWHRGLLPRARHRLMFQALYTLLPDPKIEPAPVTIAGFVDGWRERYGKALTPEQLRYVTRLVVE